MNFEDLHTGLVVRIIDWTNETGYRPEHWCEDGDMDEWQNEIVTIAELDEYEERVFIQEDEGAWQWYPWDFEPYIQLPEDDPNIKYRMYRRSKFLEELRKGLKND